MVIKRFDVVMGCSEKGIYEEECVRYKDHAAEVARLEYELEKARTANTVHIADADLYRQAELARHERDAALAEVARLKAERDAALARSHAALVKQQERTRKARKQRDEAQKQAGELAEALRKIYS